MGRFYMYNGELGPSPRWLAEHPDFEYDPDEDCESDDYEVEDDDDVFLSERTCAECGTVFTLDELMSRFSEVMDRQYNLDAGTYEYNASEFDDNLCPQCAAADYMERHADAFDDNY